MERKEAEKRTEKVLEDYARSKLLFLDTIHEVQRTKDEQHKRTLAFHEAHVGSLTRRITTLADRIEKLRQELLSKVNDDNDLIDMVNALNKVALHAMCSGSPVDVGHDVMLLAHQPEGATVDTLSQNEPQSPEVFTLRQTVVTLKADIEMLRRALTHVVSRVQAVLELKTKDAVEEMLSETRVEVESMKDLRSDPFLMRAAEQRKQDLAAISSAQFEIERLTNEKLALTTSLRKAEQDVVQMRLKMMERDSSMAVISKRIKIIEAKLLEETSTSSKRIEEAERLAGQITKKYEAEVKRLRQVIEQGHRDKEALNREIDEQKRLVLCAKEETEEVRKEIEVAREEGYGRGRSSLQQILEDTEAALQDVTQQLSDESARSAGLFEQVQSLDALQKATVAQVEDLTIQLTRTKEDLDVTQKELEERQQGPFGAGPPRTPASREQSENGILAVNTMIEEVLEKVRGDPTQTESAIRKLAARLTKVHGWSLRSDKAKHPSVASRVSSAIHDLAACMMAVANTGVPAPPTPADLKRRQSRRESSSEGLSGPGSSTLGRSKRDFKAFTEETVVLAGSPNARGSKHQRSKEFSGDRSKTRTTMSSDDSSERRQAKSSEQDRDSEEMSGDESTEGDFVDTPSSSEDDGEEMFARVAKKSSIGCSCVPSVMDRAIQVPDANSRRSSEVNSNQMRRASTKLVKREPTVTFEGSPAKSDNSNASPRGSHASSPNVLSRVSPGRNFGSGDWARAESAGSSVEMLSREMSWKEDTELEDGDDDLSSICVIENAMRRNIEVQHRRFLVELENAKRSAVITQASFHIQTVIAKRVETLKGKSSSLGAFVACKEAEAHRSAVGEARDLAVVREMNNTFGMTPVEREHHGAPSTVQEGNLDNISVVAQEYAKKTFEEFPVALPDTVIPAAKYNEVVDTLEQAKKEIDGLFTIKELLTVQHERTHAKLEVLLNNLDDGGKRLLSQASHLPMFTVLDDRPRNAPVKIVSEEAQEELRVAMEVVSWFLLEGQRLISKKFLPGGRPIAFEGRTPVNTQQAQERLGVLLASLRAQKDSIVADAKKRAMKNKRRAQEIPEFLDSPDVNASLEGPEAATNDAPDREDDIVLEPIEDNALAKRLQRSPRRDVRPLASPEVTSDDEEFVPPEVPKLHFPVNPSLQKLELDSFVQPLLKALRKKFVSLHLENLLDTDQRIGTSITLESSLNDVKVPTQASARDVLSMQAKGLKAILSLESGMYLRDDMQHDFFHAMFNSFPKPLLQKLTTDFSPEGAFQLVLRLSEWWDNWSKHISSIQQALEGRKTDQLRRLVELAEVTEAAVEAEGKCDSIADASRSTARVAEELIARAARREDMLQRQLNHPDPNSFGFSLQNKTRVVVSQTNELKTNRGKWRRPHENPLMSELTEVCEAVAADLDPRGASLHPTSPIPTVATLSPAPQWNNHAKKPVSKWDSVKLPPLK